MVAFSSGDGDAVTFSTKEALERTAKKQVISDTLRTLLRLDILELKEGMTMENPEMKRRIAKCGILKAWKGGFRRKFE